jgi:ribonuclease-3
MTSLPSFRRSPLLTQALTHSSYVNEHPEVGESNERLEFLGDAVLKFVMGKLLYERYPQFQEGDLSRLRASLENNRHQLASFALDLELDKLLLLGKGTAKGGARQNPEILSDAFEAVVGAYFLDAGIDAAIAFIEDLVIPIADQLVQEPEATVSLNPKGELQEWALAQHGEIPQYKTTKETGADHNKTFTVVVSIRGEIYAQGIAHSKKLAQKAAAQEALRKLTQQEPVTSNERLALLQSLANQI